jgi:hypothetical protein
MQSLIAAAMLTVVVDDHVRREDLLLHCIPLGVQTHLVDLPADAEQQRIARGPRNQESEFPIPSGKGVLVIDRGFSAREHHHVVEVASRCVQHSKPRGEGLNRESGL